MGLPFAGPSEDPLTKEQIAQKDHGQNPPKATNLPFIPGFAQVEDPKKSGHQNQVHGQPNRGTGFNGMVYFQVVGF
jgi:hypothetical protein